MLLSGRIRTMRGVDMVLWEHLDHTREEETHLKGRKDLSSVF